MKEKFWDKYRFLVKPFLILSAIYLVGISAILLANMHYADDAARTNYGYAGWSGFSRYISTLASFPIHADGYLTNIAPLPQLLAVMILAASSMMVICLVNGREIFKAPARKWILKLVAVVPLALCPYMLECLSYQYDAVYMALSVFFAVMPFMFYRQEKWKFVAASMVGILGVCMTYQAAIGIYPMLVVFLVMKDWNGKNVSGKELFKNIVIPVVVFLITLVFFQKVLMRAQDIYVSNEIPGITELIPMTVAHLVNYFKLLVSDFRILWLVIIAVMAVLFIVLYAVRSKRNKVLAVLVAVGGLALMSIAMYIMYAALEKPLYTTRAMYAVGMLIAIMGVYIVSGEISKKYEKKYVGKQTEMTMQMKIRVNELVLALPVIAIAWCFFVFGFTYGNALHEQDNFRNTQTDMVLADLNEIMADGKMRKIQVVGQIGFAPSIEHMPANKYHILRRLLKPSFEMNVPWMVYSLREASGIPGLIYDVNDKEILTKYEELEVVKNTALYIIYGDTENVVVKFKGEEFNIWEG